MLANDYRKGKMIYTILVDICWLIIGIVWGFGALYNMTHSPAAAKRGARTSILTLIVLGLLFVSEHWGPTHLWASLIVRSNSLADAGSLVLLVGTVFTLWARLTLGTMWSSSPVARVDHMLKTTGPYAVTRNPIYTGLLTMLAGTALIKGIGVWGLYLVAGIIFFEFKIRMEELLLVETFGERYLRYRQHVPQLIPGINLIPRINLHHRSQHVRG